MTVDSTEVKLRITLKTDLSTVYLPKNSSEGICYHSCLNMSNMIFRSLMRTNDKRSCSVFLKIGSFLVNCNHCPHVLQEPETLISYRLTSIFIVCKFYFSSVKAEVHLVTSTYIQNLFL